METDDSALSLRKILVSSLILCRRIDVQVPQNAERVGVDFRARGGEA